jgi:xanthine dehydrogenase iron-sulfur cluster and FAD-binding subunit A
MVEGMDITDRQLTAIARAVHLTVNDREYTLDIDPRESLLDVLRERLDLTGTKKGCDQGACGACTVHVDGRRVLSRLTLAVRCAGRRVTTIEGVAGEGGLHPLQRAFVEGGVATRPWRARETEAMLAGLALDDRAAMREAASAAFADARPLRDNTFKIELGTRAIVRALRQAGGAG